jgi:glyoxylase-like metal-dependent hydrolase (beta-lactamase superfamily II)
VEIVRGIRRVGSTKVNVYLVEEAGSVTIIDAGLPGYWGDVAAELTAMGRTLEDVRAVVLTHAHDDHIGFAERMRAERGTAIEVHEADAALARGEAKRRNEGGGTYRPVPVITFLAYAIRKGYLRTKRIAEVVTFGDGATLDVPGSPRVIHVPGHTAGSAALHLPDRGVIFVGDALVTLNVVSGSSGPQLFPNFNADNRQAVASLARFDDIDARFVLPGHGDPWTGGMADALRRVRGTIPDAWRAPAAASSGSSDEAAPD